MKRHIRLFAVYGLIPFSFAGLLFFWVVSIPTSGKPYEYKETSNQETTSTQEPTAEEVQINSTQPTYEADPIITCTNEKCGNREVRQSVCNASTCCQVGDTWQWTESQSLCYQMQSDERRKADELKQKQYEFDVAEAEQENKEYEQEQDKLKQECSSRATQQYLDCNNNCNTNPYTGCTDSCKRWYDTSMTTCK